MEHICEKHENCVLTWEGYSCPICDGGLSVCAVCRLCEGCLTTECPGESCYSTHADDVYAGKIDFQGGQWVQMVSKHCPAYYLQVLDQEKDIVL